MTTVHWLIAVQKPWTHIHTNTHRHTNSSTTKSFGNPEGAISKCAKEKRMIILLRVDLGAFCDQGYLFGGAVQSASGQTQISICSRIWKHLQASNHSWPAQLSIHSSLQHGCSSSSSLPLYDDQLRQFVGFFLSNKWRMKMKCSLTCFGRWPAVFFRKFHAHHVDINCLWVWTNPSDQFERQNPLIVAHQDRCETCWGRR